MTVKKANLKKYIANKIIELRCDVNWSQAELARQADITSAAVNKIEKGHTMPSVMLLKGIAEAFKVSFSELCGEPFVEKNYDEKTFFRKFGDIKDLDEWDQQLIRALVNRLKE